MLLTIFACWKNLLHIKEFPKVGVAQASRRASKKLEVGATLRDADDLSKREKLMTMRNRKTGRSVSPSRAPPTDVKKKKRSRSRKREAAETKIAFSNDLSLIHI